MNQQKILFVDRDGTIIIEPADQQIDTLEKLNFLSGVIPALLSLSKAGYRLVMISNQDGLGTSSFPQADFDAPHQLMLRILNSQGIYFDNILICPHKPAENCDCRKPKLGLVKDYLIEQTIDRENSYVIGDRESDVGLARNMGIQGIHLGSQGTPDWQSIINAILTKPRIGKIHRKTKETDITVTVNLDQQNDIQVNSGIGFFDHMLEQLAKHGGFGLSVSVLGDLHIDEHHTVEDTALAIGAALRKALGDKLGIARYGFVLPMDEALAQVALDLSGRAFFKFDGQFNRERVGELSTELIPHFFHSLADSLQANLHISVSGENTHHMIEAMFKATGRTLRQAINKVDSSLPSTKGVL